MGFIGANKLSLEQRKSLIDLGSFVGGDSIDAFSSAPSAQVHIDWFLRSFREFAPV